MPFVPPLSVSLSVPLSVPFAVRWAAAVKVLHATHIHGNGGVRADVAFLAQFLTWRVPVAIHGGDLDTPGEALEVRRGEAEGREEHLRLAAPRSVVLNQPDDGRVGAQEEGGGGEFADGGRVGEGLIAEGSPVRPRRRVWAVPTGGGGGAEEEEEEEGEEEAAETVCVCVWRAHGG